MSIGKPRVINYYQKIKDIDHITLADYYLDVKKIPCLINSPFRQDKKPSFGIFIKDSKIFFKDFSTGEKGDMYKLLQMLWNLDFEGMCEKIYNDIVNTSSSSARVKLNSHSIKIAKPSDSRLDVRVRNWEQHDKEYWSSYGISIKWLEFAEVYPISHIIITKNDHQNVFKAEKYAYAYVEHKDNITTIKVYQPFNKTGFKWISKHDMSVISLWTKMPESGKIVCICSSTKDALCLWSNTGIPSIAIQAEGFSISDSAANELRRRFKYVCICLDCDEPGLRYAKKLSNETGFINVVLPQDLKEKDISDYYKSIQNKETFKKTISNLFENEIRKVI